jgi:hypothetical protein
VAGERDEHVVECGPAQRDVLDADVGVGEAQHRIGDDPGAPAQRRGHAAALDCRALIGDVRQRGQRPLGVGGILELDLEALAAHAVLELVGGPLGDHVAVIDHDDAIREPIGLVEVLGGEQHCGSGRSA